MPFTLSHVVAVLPFRHQVRKYFSISGLIMGSMAPDFEFFLRNTLYGIWGHTFKGIFFFDLPISILLCLIFHYWVRDKLILFSPNFIKSRFIDYLGFDWTDYLKSHLIKVIFSVLVGILTHFVWDNITHEPNYVSPFYLSFLSENLYFKNFSMPVYLFLQILSSILGLVGFLLVIFRLPMKNLKSENNQNHTNRFWALVILFSSIIFTFRYLIGIPDEKPIGQFIVISIGSSLYALTLVSIFYPKKHESPF
ncbi:DUF4184 family protein [Lacihabitans sp. LS3-19]|uniref:DUF4184 family protein n=1 Tax=Lacihabitans sp. LS3-19 TaxID=2487335 RepID=UPI0020CF5405|nr:DUF4184 family protein [Lacihabitans sp. LS3-19]MCP9766662.1 DUF4184 family protein [Lacihabitans sp. LS3-19]